MNTTSPVSPAATPDRPRLRRRGRSAVLLVGAATIALVMLAGCGRLHRGTAAGAATSTTVATAAPASSSGATSTSVAGSDSEDQTLNSISQQLSTVDSNLSAANGDIQTANSAINSQEGDPSK